MITTTFKIGELTRTLNVHVFSWGVQVVIEDKTPHWINRHFDARNFHLTKNYPTIESNIKRGMSYFKAPKDNVDEIIKNYK